MGRITLQPHQVEAARRLTDALTSFGGALLADEPGLGKTFTALAVARKYGGAVVIAPAALREQWHQSARRAEVSITWCSLETLSRRDWHADGALLVIDEAHHLRTPSAARYARAAALAVGKHVLLLSATPVHNRAADRAALFALFLGARADALGEHEASRLIVRRSADTRLLPRRHHTRSLTVPCFIDLSRALRSLPPPLPTADGLDAAGLIRMSMAHAWSSSLAALAAAATRTLQRARAIDDALRDGRWPTRQELRAWTVGSDGGQLAFPLVAASPAATSTTEALAALQRHSAGVRALRAAVAPVLDADSAARAAVLRGVLDAHPRQVVLAFAQHAETVYALHRALRTEPGVVAITSRAVRAAGAHVRREDVLRILSAEDAATDPRMPLRLVLCTDLMSEGLDLRAASVVVHLDQPWTVARLQQREGRVRRLGARHAHVTVYAVRPPPGAMRMLALGARLLAKQAAMSAAIAGGESAEQARAIVARWVEHDHHAASAPRGRPLVSAAHAGVRGYLAVLADAVGRMRLIGETDGNACESIADVLPLLRLVDQLSAAVVDHARLATVRRTLRRRLRALNSAETSKPESAVRPSARATVLRALAAQWRALPLHQRAALAARVQSARACVTRMQGAGAESALARAAQSPSIDVLLQAIEAIPVAPREHRALTAWRLVALLLLERDDASPSAVPAALGSNLAAPAQTVPRTARRSPSRPPDRA